MNKTITRKIIKADEMKEEKIRLDDLKEGNLLNNKGFLELIDKTYNHQEIKFVNTIKRNETDNKIIEKIYSISYNDKGIINLISPISVRYIREEASNNPIVYNKLNSKLKEAGI